MPDHGDLEVSLKWTGPLPYDMPDGQVPEEIADDVWASNIYILTMKSFWSLKLLYVGKTTQGGPVRKKQHRLGPLGQMLRPLVEQGKKIQWWGAVPDPTNKPRSLTYARVDKLLEDSLIFLLKPVYNTASRVRIDLPVGVRIRNTGAARDSGLLDGEYRLSRGPHVINP